ncbi:transposase [Microbacterium sp. JZ31]|uniref:transposase n=1 Tax=Microbacterium sp. JZ31 TaxID=1906274 RepID=UPI001933BD49|nr:transposase [Microbacterium sp. JZ31]
MAEDPLVGVAWELYDLPPARFTAARNARAKAVKDEDAALAKRITQLRRASAPAWIVGQLVRHRSERLAQVLELGAELREAQQDLDAAALAQLTRDRRALTAALAKEGAALARQHDVNAPSAVLDEVSQTLQAAMADADAAAAVTSGRLTRALEVVGFDPVDLTDAVAGPAPDGSPAPEAGGDELAARRARRAAERAAKEAEQALERARERLADARRRVDEHDRRAAELGARREELRGKLEKTERELARLEKAAPDIDSAREDAERRAAEAESALEDARRALDT